MLPLTPDLMRACIAEEAALRSNIAELARLLTPPLSRVRRRQLRDGLAEAKAGFARLYRLWCLRLPDPRLRALPPTHPDRRFFDRLQVRLAEAPAGFEALERLLRQGPQPLLPHPSPPDQPEAAQLTLQDRVWSRLHAGLAPMPLAAHIRENGQYEDIAYPVADFLRLLQLARRVAVALGKTKVRFLDVGCGTGLKVLMAAEMFGQAEGLEYQPDLASAAATLLRATEARIQTGDALRFDGYDAFDIIYFYKPIHVPDDLAAMEARIVAQARAGTILIAPYAGFAYRAEALGCSAIEGFVHIKGVSGKELDRLKQRVAWVGFGDPRPPTEPPQGFAAPLLAVLRAWGQLP